MKVVLLYLSVLIVHTSFAQDSLFYFISKENRLSENINFTKNKGNLLEIVQQEYCFWNDPKNRIETDKSCINKIKTYWANLKFYPTSKQIQNHYWQDRNPWSAAFISWCMNEAGYGNSFKYAPNHARYIVWANDNKINQNDSLPFWAYDVTDNEAAYPEPGDLICKNRLGNQYTLNTLNENAVSHCDVVTEIDKANGIITVIGGNVLDKVNKRWIFLKEDGFIDKNAVWLCFDTNGIAITGSQEEFFTVIKVH